MGGDPLKHPGQTIRNWIIGTVAVVIGLDLAYSIIQPYLPLIGKVVAAAIILLVIVAVIGIIRNIMSRGGGGGMFRGR